jgi:cobalamin biosynthetic protein CobC
MLQPERDCNPLVHGGRLREAATRWRIPLADWLDLSTGINPLGWPVPPDLAARADLWSRLPEDDDGLVETAAAYYGIGADSAGFLLPVAGSQAAIQALPRLRPPGRVGVIAPGYGEHARAWARAGHRVLPLAADTIDAALPKLDALVLIHPNNPTGTRLPLEGLLRWQRALAERGGWLVVDEAFMDATPEHSLAQLAPRPGLFVLRSLGKFFGLAGARVGFVLAEPGPIGAIAALLGPWSVPTPSRRVAALALADTEWQAAARAGLPAAGARLAGLLGGRRLVPAGGCALFQWVPIQQAPVIHAALARVGILTRLFDDPPALRFGLPGREPEWERLAAALTQVG